MNFTIIEEIRNHTSLDEIKKVFFSILKIFFFVIISPFLICLLVISLFENKRKDKKHIYKWEKFYSFDNIILERLYIDENELPINLDYPSIPNDIYLFKVKAIPVIKDIESVFFDMQYVVIDKGIFLLSFNNEFEGMSVWFIDNQTLKFEKVKDLESNWWNFYLKKDKIILFTSTENKDITIEISNCN